MASSIISVSLAKKKRKQKKKNKIKQCITTPRLVITFTHWSAQCFLQKQNHLQKAEDYTKSYPYERPVVNSDQNI